MANFDDFCKKHEIKRNLDYVELAWNEGAQSRQSEVDELQQKIAKALYLINMCEGHCSVDSIRKILEGENHES